MEEKIAYLQMIEGVVDRMGHNSFQLKGWTVTLMTIVGALSVVKNGDIVIIVKGVIPLTVFWFLDSYYLQLERKYRILYDHVRKDKNIQNFDMGFSELLYTNDEHKKAGFCNCVFSRTEALFYLIIIAIFILVIVLMHGIN